MNIDKPEEHQDLQKNFFIGLEAVTITFLGVLAFYSLEPSSSMMAEIFEGVMKLTLATSLPIWIIGAFHLHRIGKMKHYGKAFWYFLGICLALLLISIAIPPFYFLSLVSVIIAFNYFAFRSI